MATAVVIDEMRRILGGDTARLVGSDRMTQHDLHAEGAAVIANVKANTTPAQYEVCRAFYGHGSEFAGGVLMIASTTYHMAPAGVGRDAWRVMTAQSFGSKTLAQVGSTRDVSKAYGVHHEKQAKSRAFISKYIRSSHSDALSRLDTSLASKISERT
jgi:hypothetical protein